MGVFLRGEEKREHRRREKGKQTEVFDGGMNGVTTFEEEMNEPGSNATTPTGNAHYLTLSLRRHLCFL